jgi:pantoate--beta-alanine ligase
MTRLVRDTAALRAALAAQENQPATRQYRRAVVMTMGALHAGHLSLVRRARELADHVVVTIFVNPLQFGPTEDLARYPRDLEGDRALLSGEGLLGDGDVVFAPTPDVMYPGGDPVARVTAGRIGEVLEGAFRPGHLDGVLTVVLKLMHLTDPDVALFGQKDAQQLAAVRRMVRDLDVPLDVVGVPIVRDPDGLAMSSRNAYLSPDERRRALSLSRSLAAANAAADDGKAPDEVRAAAVAVLTGPDGVDSLDYAALVDPATFEDVAPTATGPALLALAARVGGTRLIDNAELTLR